MAAKKAAKTAVKPAPAKASAGRAHKPKAPKVEKEAPPQVAAVEKMSVTDRISALEAWALESGAHMPHLVAGADASGAQ